MIVQQKGGEGSGNFGHEGRPGLVGGSAPGIVDILVELEPDDARVEPISQMSEDGYGFLHGGDVVYYPNGTPSGDMGTHAGWMENAFEKAGIPYPHFWSVMLQEHMVRFQRQGNEIGLHYIKGNLRDETKDGVLALVHNQGIKNVYIDVVDKDGRILDKTVDPFYKELEEYGLTVKEHEDTAMIGLRVADPAYFRTALDEYAGDDALPLQEDLHVTLVYLGDISKLNRDAVVQAITCFAGRAAPVQGTYNGVAQFCEENGKIPLVLLFDCPGLDVFRRDLMGWVAEMDMLVDEPDHGFTPHTTLTYLEPGSEVKGSPVHPFETGFDSISLFWGNDISDYSLTGDIVYKQLPINEHSREILSNIRIELFNNDANRLAERVFTGDITLGQWEETMKGMIREMHSSMAAIGKGGWDEMTQSDWGKIGSEVKKQYKYLHNFASTIDEKRDTITLPQIQTRARMYGQASISSEIRMEAGWFWDQLPWMPKDGSTECLVNCKCYWELEITGITKQYQLVEAAWMLRDAEHCADCVDRDGYTTTLRVPLDAYVPSSIG